METLSDLPKKACNRCRLKKVKCDIAQSAAVSCSQCRLSGVACVSTFPRKRRGPKPRERLTNVEHSLLLDQRSPSVDGRSARQVGQLESNDLHWINPNGSLASSQSPASQSGSACIPPFNQLYQQLRDDLSRAIPNINFEAITTKCVDLYFKYIFPLIPIVHEGDLRQGFKNVWAAYSHSRGNQIETWQAPHLGRGSNISFEPIADAEYMMPTFTLVTALCAETAAMLPVQLFAEGPLIADAFLQASRNSLNQYLEADMEHPNANSVAIRYFHSNCLHAAGKPRFSWHILGEAARLAQMMSLYDEAAYEGIATVEAELRRRTFWILYIGDKSAAILNNRPITLHKFNFESGITVTHAAETIDYPTPARAPGVVDTTNRSIITGFNFNLILWKAASDLLLEMRLMNEHVPNAAKTLTSEHRSRINTLYVNFMTCLDDLPPWLQIEQGVFNDMEHEGEQNCSEAFVIQRVNLRVSFHCLRMVITKKFDDARLSTTGIEIEQSSTVALRKTEIARDMVRAIREAPFWALQVNGESCVEKIRLIGASLLEVIHTNQNSPLAARARAEFVILLDILTRLDSKASDALRNESSWQG